MRTMGLVAVCALAVAMFVSSAGADSLLFRGDAAHSGVYAGTPIARDPVLAWTFKTKDKVLSSPAVADGVAFVGSADGNLYAIDAATGAQKWKFRTAARIVSSPAVANGIVYVESYDGNLYALDQVAGTVKWTFATKGERRFAATHIHGVDPVTETMPDPFDVYLSSPTVSNRTVYFGSGDGFVYALDATSGALKWKFQTGNVVHASPAVADGMVFVGSWDSYFYALDAESGRQVWRFTTGVDPKIHNQEGIQSSAAVAGGAVYFGCRDSNLYALDEKTGRELWALNNKGSWVISSPAVRDGKVYAATSDTGKFYEVDARTGAVDFAVDFKGWPMFSSPALVGQYAFIGSHQGKLFAIDLNRKAVAWSFQTEASRRLLAQYSMADGTPNYYAVQSGNFYDDVVAANAKLMELGSIYSSPVYAGGMIIFGSTDGNVYALKGPR